MRNTGKHTFTSLTILRGKPVFTLSISLAIPSQIFRGSDKEKKSFHRDQLNVSYHHRMKSVCR